MKTERSDRERKRRRASTGRSPDRYQPSRRHRDGSRSSSYRKNKRSEYEEDQRRREPVRPIKRWGKPSEQEDEKEETKKPKEKANFGLSGALNEDHKTGKVYRGVVLKWSEPPEARVPKLKWRFYVFKGDELLETLYLHRQSAYLVGRHEKVADILLLHESVSKQHAVIQFKLKVLPEKDENGDSKKDVRPYLLDLDSANGTFINGEEVPSARYIELKEKDVIKFGESTREHVLLNERSSS